MKRGLLDTNFLMAPYQFKVDVIRKIKDIGYEPLVLSCVLEELKKLAEKRSKEGMAARVALELIEKSRLEVKEAAGAADSALMRYAKTHGCVVATNDKKLIEKLRKNGIEVIRLRQRKLVVVE